MQKKVSETISSAEKSCQEPFQPIFTPDRGRVSPYAGAESRCTASAAPIV